MTKPHHMRPPGRPMRGPDIKLTDHVNTPLSSATRDADIENLSKVQNSRPLKPPRRRRV